MSSSWREVLKQQHEDLDRLEAEDAALNNVGVVEEADKILRKPESITFAASTMRKAKMGRGKREDPLDLRLPEPKLEDNQGESRPEAGSQSARGSGEMPLGSPGGATPPAFAVDANSRYNKARTLQVQQQLDNSEQLRFCLLYTSDLPTILLV